LLARIYEVLPLLCPKCSGDMRIIAFITEGAVIREILGHLGEPTSPPKDRKFNRLPGSISAPSSHRQP